MEHHETDPHLLNYLRELDGVTQSPDGTLHFKHGSPAPVQPTWWLNRAYQIGQILTRWEQDKLDPLEDRITNLHHIVHHLDHELIEGFNSRLNQLETHQHSLGSTGIIKTNPSSPATPLTMESPITDVHSDAQGMDSTPQQTLQSSPSAPDNTPRGYAERNLRSALASMANALAWFGRMPARDAPSTSSTSASPGLVLSAQGPGVVPSLYRLRELLEVHFPNPGVQPSIYQQLVMQKVNAAITEVERVLGSGNTLVAGSHDTNSIREDESI